MIWTIIVHPAGAHVIYFTYCITVSFGNSNDVARTLLYSYSIAAPSSRKKIVVFILPINISRYKRIGSVVNKTSNYEF